MIFSLLVLESPVGRQTSYAAYRFASAALAGGHEILRVFFYGDGVYTGTELNSLPGHEPNLPALWQTLAATHRIDLVVCSTSALRRGIVDTKEAVRIGKSASNLREGFEISGLGQWVESCIRSDRIMSFGTSP